MHHISKYLTIAAVAGSMMACTEQSAVHESCSSETCDTDWADGLAGVLCDATGRQAYAELSLVPTARGDVNEGSFQRVSGLLCAEDDATAPCSRFIEAGTYVEDSGTLRLNIESVAIWDQGSLRSQPTSGAPRTETWEYVVDESTEHVIVAISRDQQTQLLWFSNDADCGMLEAPSVSERMVVVPQGPYMMGCADADERCADDEFPYHQVTLDSFAIDMTEVTQAAYDKCVLAGACSTPPRGFEPGAQADFPVTNIDWYMAEAYCDWSGKDLCTEAQWEKAARGTDGRLYPWGDEDASCALAIMDDEQEACGGPGGSWPVGSRPDGASPYGALDMAGNVSEWVKDRFHPDFYESCEDGCSNPLDTWQCRDSFQELTCSHGHRGGAYLDDSETVRSSERVYNHPDSGMYNLGFRCCKPNR